MKTVAKFKIGDLVGWRSNSDFTASNKLKPPMKVAIVRYHKQDGWLYVLCGNAGIVHEFEIEAR